MGLRQGDPLSPYLFVLSMNCLSLALNKAAQEGRFKYHSKCQKTRVTHLCFADDLLIFTDGSLQSVAAILEVLKDFESRSGLQWGIQTDPSCLLCNALSESRDHLLFDCSFSWIIWRKCSLKCNFQSSRNWDTTLTHLRNFTPPETASDCLASVDISYLG